MWNVCWRRALSSDLCDLVMELTEQQSGPQLGAELTVKVANHLVRLWNSPSEGSEILPPSTAFGTYFLLFSRGLARDSSLMFVCVYVCAYACLRVSDRCEMFCTRRRLEPTLISVAFLFSFSFLGSFSTSKHAPCTSHLSFRELGNTKNAHANLQATALFYYPYFAFPTLCYYLL